ncbi:uncharacterized protein FIBRA_00930 [Fibroporia radiculosa]|uniref:Mediator of RNA polymerase II transcription subunit 21 n=1 Tax=Fibroporia radiculosa TaxID=599839 RepID=J4G0P5_9APHY|nr:uncharacterized protein FIBRA_00930 [Fibroporia radiculosa]CCL98923.1 predicted protein [Fibroporia radiculosa]
MLQELSHMDRITQLQDEIQQLLTIMSNSVAYLTSRANFLQKASFTSSIPNKRELVRDLVVKAKQIDYLIQSLPEPESEEVQAGRLECLEEEMTEANTDYVRAVNRAKHLHQQISDVLRTMLDESDLIDEMPG